MNGPRASQLSGSTQFGSTVSLNTMASNSTLTGSGGPVTATSNIINQRADASRSLYQICVSTKQRLSQVPGFEGYMQQLASPQAISEGPVESLWDLLRSGHPLLVVYNALQPATPLSVDDASAAESKRSKIAVFKFVQACLRELNIPSGECFVINDLLGNDTTGFVKVTGVINYVLDLAEGRGLLKTIEANPEQGGEQRDSKMTYRDHIIKEMVDTERKYVQDLENLHNLKESLEQRGNIPGTILHSIFLNINAILDFQRRFLIRVETTNSMPPEEQQWGAPFAYHEESFNIYQPFIANQRKAAQVANQVFDKISVINHPVAVDFNTLDGFLLKPMQRLVKYPLLLKDLNKKTDDPMIKADLISGFEAAERVLSKANEAVNRDLLDEAVEDLRRRVDDWKGHEVEQFGRLLLHGVHTVVTGRAEKESDVRTPEIPAAGVLVTDIVIVSMRSIFSSTSCSAARKYSPSPRTRRTSRRLMG
jgi:cell division control protein 24